MFMELDKQGHIIGTAEWKFSDAAVQTEREIVRGYDGRLYFKGQEPAQPEPTAAEKVAQLELQYNLPRAVRELVLAEKSSVSEFVKNKAREIETLAAPLREAAE